MIALWSNVVVDEILSKVARHSGQRFIVSESSSFCLFIKTDGKSWSFRLLYLARNKRVDAYRV